MALDPSAVQLRGRLDPISTMASRSYIVPVVGHARGASVVAASGCAKSIASSGCRLAELTRSDTFREEVWHFDGDPRPIFFFELDDETIWGATARILHQLLRVALGIDSPEPPAL